jgi:hypothetical protein
VDALIPPEDVAVGVEDLGAAIRHAQAELERAVREGGLSRDPMRLPLGALAVTLGAIEKLFQATVAQFRITSEDLDHRLTVAVEKANQPTDPKAMERLRIAAARGASQEVLALVRAHNQRTTLVAGAVLAGSMLFAGIVGFCWGRWSAEADIHETELTLSKAFKDGPEAASDWANLMSHNNLPAAMVSCTGSRVVVQDGRRACAIPLWLDPMQERGPPPLR